MTDELPNPNMLYATKPGRYPARTAASILAERLLDSAKDGAFWKTLAAKKDAEIREWLRWYRASLTRLRVPAKLIEEEVQFCRERLLKERGR